MAEKNKRDIGKEGEDIAAKYLAEKGFEIIERNYHYSHGEIDIVAKDKNHLVFIEVKSRINLDYGEPEYAINPKKIKQIKKMAELYLFDKEIDEADAGREPRGMESNLPGQGRSSGLLSAETGRDPSALSEG